MRTNGTVNPQMLVLARESRGLTQKELADETHISQGNISKFESGLLGVSTDHLTTIALFLGYPETFFFQTESVYGYGSRCLYHRKRQSLLAHDLRRIIAELNVLRLQVSRLLRNVEVRSENSFYRMDLIDYENCPEVIAQLIRKSWNLPTGPIQNLTKTIESCGGVVVKHRFGTTKIDAISQWVPGMPPLFFINSEIPGDRLRFTLAHELGHIIMHEMPTPDLESEANRFAAEFMMPSREIGPQLHSLSLPRLAELKGYWKIAMSAITKRAFDLGKITPRYYRGLFTQMSKLGIRRCEPVSIPIEEPHFLSKVIEVHRKHYGYSIADLSALVMSREEEFCSLYLSESNHLRIVR